MSLLVDSLVPLLDAASQAALLRPGARRAAEEYLSLLVNEQLSTESFTALGLSRLRTLTEEIAELDAALRQLELRLAAATSANRALVVGAAQALALVHLALALATARDVALLQHTLRETPLLALRHAHSAATSTTALVHADATLDLLELPTLCRLCVAQGRYQEALEVAASVKVLGARLQMAAFRAMQRRVAAELAAMGRALVRSLHTNLKQAAVLRVFALLSHPDMPRAGSAPLNAVYLASRFKFIADEVRTLEPLLRLRKHTYLKRLVEVYREHLFNLLHMHGALFPNPTTHDRLLLRHFVASLARLLADAVAAHMPEQGPDPEAQSQRDGVVLLLVYLARSLTRFHLDFECALARALCGGAVSETEWTRNAARVKKFR